MGRILAEFRYKRKRHAAKASFGQILGMRRPGKPAKTKPPKTPLQALFMARLGEELQKRSLNPNQLGKRSKTLKIGNVQRQAQDILNGISDPRLETIYKICMALKVDPCELLQHSDSTVNNVIALPEPESIMGELAMTGNKTRLKKNKRR